MPDSLSISNSEDEWLFVYVLHNLSIKQPIGNEYVAIVPPSDQRIITLIREQANLQHLVSHFVDQFNRRVTPCVLIARSSSPSTILQSDALVSFRNVVAICYIVESWQDYLNRGWCLYAPGYSNYFDIYPIIPSKDFQHLLTISPAVHGLDMPNKFSGQTSPELNGSLYEIQYDSLIFNTLNQEWEKRYVKEKLANWKTTALFRSLQMAYQASVIPMNNRSTIYDYGLSLALWVSAFEILVRPKSERADLYKVLNLLGREPFQSRRLFSKRYSIPYNKNSKRRVTLPQKLYYQIYKARNDFLHGNPVTIKHLYPWNNPKRNLLNCFAPLLYKLALISFLNVYCYNGNIADLPFEQYKSIRGLEEGLAKAAIDQNEKE